MMSTHVAITGQSLPPACVTKYSVAAPSHFTGVQERFVVSPQAVVPAERDIAQASVVCETPPGVAQSLPTASPQEPMMELHAQGELTQKWLQTLPKFTPPTWSGRLPVPESPEYSPFEESHATMPVLSSVVSWTNFEQRRHDNCGEGASVQHFSDWPQVVNGCPNLLAETLEALPSALLLEQLQIAKASDEANANIEVDSLATTISAHSNAMHDSEYCFDHTGLSSTQPLFPEAVLTAALVSGPFTTGLSSTHPVLPQVVVLATSVDITPHQRWRSQTSDLRCTI